MLSPRGGRTNNGWWMGDELCHQTRGLKDGPLECYQSCLDQDVRLSRSSVFSLLSSSSVPHPSWAHLPPSPLLPHSPPPRPFASLLLPLFFPFLSFSRLLPLSFSIFLHSHSFLPLPLPPSLCLSSIFSNSGPFSLSHLGPAWPMCYVGKIFISNQTTSVMLLFSVVASPSPLPGPTDGTERILEVMEWV